MTVYFLEFISLFSFMYFIFLLRSNNSVFLKDSAMWLASVQFIASTLVVAEFYVRGDFLAQVLSGGFFSGALLVDGLSVWLLSLTALLTFLSVIISWKSLTYRVAEFYAALFLVQALLFNVFLVTDILLFYLFFEALAVPMFFIIGVWGSRMRKVSAAYYLFFYTVISSVLMLTVILYVYAYLGATDFYSLRSLSAELSWGWGQFVFWSLFISFASKMPLVPVHLWLPEAHVEAPQSAALF